MNKLLEAAKQYKELGLSVVPVGTNKDSTIYWKRYQQAIIADTDLCSEFQRPQTKGIALICGGISGNLEGIDIDSKYDLSGSLANSYLKAIQTQNRTLFDQLIIASTKNNGMHFYYRCEEIARRIILARRPTTEEEQRICPEEKIKILIEGRANGEYMIVPPTPGYRFIQHSLEQIAAIRPADRQMILAIGRSFNLYHKVVPTRRTDTRIYSPSESPLDCYDLDARRKENVIELLLKHSWVFVEDIYPRTYFRRPGQTDHRTSGDYHEELNLFTVFTSGTEFEPIKGYRPHAVYAELECGGDYRRAAKELVAAGFGVAYKDRNRVC
jgi:hypothetical protein